MIRHPIPAPATDGAPVRRPLRAFLLEAVRSRFEQRRDLQSRRATQALIDVSLVLNAQQRQAIAGQLTDGPRPFATFPHPPAASAATTWRNQSR